MPSRCTESGAWISFAPSIRLLNTSIVLIFGAVVLALVLYIVGVVVVVLVLVLVLMLLIWLAIGKRYTNAHLMRCRRSFRTLATCCRTAGR